MYLKIKTNQEYFMLKCTKCVSAYFHLTYLRGRFLAKPPPLTFRIPDFSLPREADFRDSRSFVSGTLYTSCEAYRRHRYLRPFSLSLSLGWHAAEDIAAPEPRRRQVARPQPRVFLVRRSAERRPIVTPSGNYRAPSGTHNYIFDPGQINISQK